MIEFEDLLYRYKVPRFKYKKEKLVAMVDNIKAMSITNLETDETISKTDFFNLGPNPDGRYHLLVEEVLNEFLHNAENDIKTRLAPLPTIWHQEYRRGDSHGWHIHGPSSYSMVLYLELPNEDCGTEFRFAGKTYRPKVTEGEILLFPAFLHHRSPPHEHDERKLIVSTNFETVEIMKT